MVFMIIILLKQSFLLKPNGPAIKGGYVAEWMEAGAVSSNRGRVLIPARMNEAWRTFCRHGTNFIEHYEFRGTSLNGAANLSPVTNLEAGTGAVSRYK
jgi:phage major head subunit gpT-like protein